MVLQPELTRQPLSAAMRPLVSLLIRKGVTHKRFSELLKAVFVEVASREYGKRGRPTNVTRISLLTGLDRKQVKRLHDERLDPATARADSHSSVLGRVLSAWHQDDEFAYQGAPKPLSIDDGFRRLCKRYGGDRTHTAILKELLNARAVEKNDPNTVIAVSRFYLPKYTDPAALERSLEVYRDLGSTLRHNLCRTEGQPSRFEGRATNAFVPKEKLDELRAFVEGIGQRCLEEADRQFSKAEDAGAPGSERARVGLGMYWIHDCEGC